MEPFDIVMQLVPQLTDKQKKKVAELLNLKLCEVQGHKYKKVGESEKTFWSSAKTIISICERCGKEIKTEGK